MSLQYTKTTKTLHWTIAVLIIGLLCLGFYMYNLRISPAKLKLYSWHKWVGVTTFLLALVRLIWRSGHGVPSLTESMLAAQRLVAHLGHFVLYVFMFATPLSSWAMSAAKGFQTVAVKK